MTDLDKKLCEAVLGKGFSDTMPMPNFVNKIRDAFMDDGWRKIPRQADIQPLIDDGTVSPLITKAEWEAQAIKDGWNKPFDSEGIINFGTEEQPILIHKDSPIFSPESGGGYIDIPEGHNGKVLMTGQEWYFRFEKEYRTKPAVQDIHLLPNAILMDIEDIKSAARKASGIE